MTFKERIELESKKEKIILIVALILIIGGGIYSFFESKKGYYNVADLNDLSNDLEIIDNNESKGIEEQKKNEENGSNKKVYITGEITNPGVYEISNEERIEDIINKAGGVTDKANLKDVNLAYKLEDGQKIYIPNIYDKEEIEIVSTENGENVIKGEAKKGKININNANIEELCELPGIGEAMAKRIIEYREKNGKFKAIEELKNVNGIGEKKYENLKDFIEK